MIFLWVVVRRGLPDRCAGLAYRTRCSIFTINGLHAKAAKTTMSFPMRFQSAYPLFFAALCISMFCRAQPSPKKTAFDFEPREIVIFEDDFSADEIGALPANWQLLLCDEQQEPVTDMLTHAPGMGERIRQQKTKSIKVVSTNHGNALELGTSFYHLVPSAHLAAALRDSFTLELDYQMTSPDIAAWAEITLLVGEHKLSPVGTYYRHNFDIVIERSGALCLLGPKPIPTPSYLESPFDADGWHHLAIAFCNGELSVYRDSTKLQNVIIPPSVGKPGNVLFRNWPTVKYTNVRIATGPRSRPVHDLLIHKKLITHYIFFDFGSANIKPGSMGYINELVHLLAKNKSLKLQINGHTDSTGSAASNQLLSEQRSTAVKQALITRGISANRLSTKGFGYSKPLRPGNSDEDKAANRRVEFIPK